MLDVSGSVVRRAVRATLAELAWDSELEGDQTVAWEDPVRLCCSMSPVKARIGTTDHGDDATQVRSAGLEQRIRRWAANPTTGSSDPVPVAP